MDNSSLPTPSGKEHPLPTKLPVQNVSTVPLGSPQNSIVHNQEEPIMIKHSISRIVVYSIVSIAVLYPIFFVLGVKQITLVVGPIVGFLLARRYVNSTNKETELMWAEAANSQLTNIPNNRDYVKYISGYGLIPIYNFYILFTGPIYHKINNNYVKTRGSNKLVLYIVALGANYIVVRLALFVRSVIA